MHVCRCVRVFESDLVKSNSIFEVDLKNIFVFVFVNIFNFWRSVDNSA
jgi:hypothetical protein